MNDFKERLVELMIEADNKGYTLDLVELNQLFEQITKQNDRKRDTRTDDKE